MYTSTKNLCLSLPLIMAAKIRPAAWWVNGLALRWISSKRFAKGIAPLLSAMFFHLVPCLNTAVMAFPIFLVIECSTLHILKWSFVRVLKSCSSSKVVNPRRKRTKSTSQFLGRLNLVDNLSEHIRARQFSIAYLVSSMLGSKSRGCKVTGSFLQVDSSHSWCSREFFKKSISLVTISLDSKYTTKSSKGYQQHDVGCWKLNSLSRRHKFIKRNENFFQYNIHAKQGNLHHTTWKIKHATNSLHTSVSENALQGKTHQVQNSHDDKQLATTTLNMSYVQLRS